MGTLLLAAWLASHVQWMAEFFYSCFPLFSSSKGSRLHGNLAALCLASKPCSMDGGVFFHSFFPPLHPSTLLCSKFGHFLVNFRVGIWHFCEKEALEELFAYFPALFSLLVAVLKIWSLFGRL